MKRSDMIEIISRKLERCHDRYGNLFKFDIVANELLEDIEEVGMLPPFSLTTKITGTKNILGQHLEFIWESETEDENVK